MKASETFLRFKVSNKNLHNSKVYRKCQRSLLKEEIKSKRRRISILKRDFNNLKKDLHNSLSFFDFTHICTLFLVANDKSISKIDTRQK